MENRPSSSQHRLPVVGIFVNTRYRDKIAQQLPPYSAELNMQAANAVGLLAYYFSLQDVDVDEQSIRGWKAEADGKWVQSPMPLPDILYDRGVNFRRSQYPQLEEIREWLYNITKRINTTRAISKWREHKLLRRHAATQKLLPDTVLYKDRAALEMMLERHRFILVKPSWGAGGTKISRIGRNSDGTYSWQNSSTEATHDSVDLKKANRLTRKALKPRKSAIIQQQLELLRVNRSPFDIRVLVAKDGAGKWFPASSRARIGSQGRFVTNTRQGASRIPLHEALLTVLGSDELATSKLACIHAACISIAHQLEQEVGPMGEMGLDLVLDTKLRLWFLEANACPDKKPMPCEMSSDGSLIYKTVMEYAIYLYNQSHDLRMQG